MIVDRIDQVGRYASVLPGLRAGLECFRAADFDRQKHYDFEGGFMNFFEGRTEAYAQGRFEAHRRYVDIQILLSGRETIYWERRERLHEVEAYDEQRDIAFYESAEQPVGVDLVPGSFAILFPEDGHMPTRHPEGEAPSPFEKAVIKILLADDAGASEDRL